MPRRILAVFAALSIALSSGLGGYWFYADARSQAAAAAGAYETPAEADAHVRFDMEIFDIIADNYWQKATEADLAELFRLSLGKAAGADQTLPSRDRAGTAAMLAQAMAATPAEKRTELAVNTGIVALANLAPQGRSGLLSQSQEQQFRDTANNVDRGTDLYAALDLPHDATSAEAEAAYVAKAAALSASTSPEAKEALAQAERAKAVLADPSAKGIYDETKIEPSLVSRRIGAHTLYIDLSKVTPATLQEFVHTLETSGDDPQLTGMILDVRGNVGGTLDFAKYLLGLFIGPNQYAFDLFHQGDLQVERTPAIATIEALSAFKDIAILTDAMTQSTAELTSAIFKRMRLARVVGEKTRGWGTVENTFPIETTLDGGSYAVLLVHSLTLRADNQPVEGNGVAPDIDTTQEGWKQEVRAAFRTPGFADAVIGLFQ